jgi:hypothetical protein
MVAHGSHTSVLIDLLTKGERLNAVGLYTIANRVNPIVSTRQGRGKWHVAKKGESTTDHDILSRQVLIVDCDATRPKGTSASDEEVACAHAVAERIRDQFIALLGSDASIGVGHTGNGAMVLLALDSLEEAPQLVEAIKIILAMLSELFATAQVSIDRSVSDAKRLVPAWGTRKRKGAPDVPERPHRLTSFLCADKVQPLSKLEVYKLVLALSEQLTDEQLMNARIAAGEKPAASAQAGASPDRAPLRDTPFGRVNSIPIESVVRWLGLLDGDDEADSEDARSGAGAGLLRVASGAAYDDLLPPGVPASHGYSIGAVVAADDGSLRLCIWPRRWSDQNKDFRVDVNNVPQGRPYAEHTLSGLRLPAKAGERPPG